MTAKEYLSQARSIRIRFETMAEQLAVLKSAAEYISPRLSEAPASSRNPHKNEDAMIRVVEMEERIAAAREKLIEVSEVINKVADPTQQAILVKRYLRNKTWAEISDEVHYSLARVYEIHRDALRSVEAVGEWHSRT